MTEIQRTRIIAARVQEVRDVLADFGAIVSWADNVDHSCILCSGPGRAVVGTTRRVQVKRYTLVERITEFDPPHTLAYDIEGLPRLLRRVANRWILAANSADSVTVRLTTTVDIGPRLPQRLAERLVCQVVARQSDSMLAGLANRLENARV